MFEGLIDPITVDEFVDEYWEKQLLYLGRKGEQNFDHIISVDEIEDFLSRTDIRHPSLRLVKDGEELALRDYTRELRLGSHVSHDLIDNEKMFQCFRQGATIVLQFLQHNVPRFGRFTNSLEAAFNCIVHGSCFITPPGSQGFTSHYDTYSFFVLQVEGTKLWKIYPRTALPPIREDRLTDEPWKDVEPVREIMMKKGDFLYLPRGVFHAAASNDVTSIHMTLGFFVPTWIDIIKSALVQCYSSELLRRAPLRPDGKLRSTEIEEVKGFLLEKLNLESGLAALADEYFSNHVDGRRGRLRDLSQAHEIDFKTIVGLQHNLPFRFRQNADRTKLAFADKELSLPASAKRTLEYVLANGPCRIDEIVDLVEPNSRLSFIKLLVIEGFLTRHTSAK